MFKKRTTKATKKWTHALKGLPVSAHCSSVVFQVQPPAPPVFLAGGVASRAKNGPTCLGSVEKKCWKFLSMPVGSLSARLAAGGAVAELSSCFFLAALAERFVKRFNDVCTICCGK